MTTLGYVELALMRVRDRYNTPGVPRYVEAAKLLDDLAIEIHGLDAEVQKRTNERAMGVF